MNLRRWAGFAVLAVFACSEPTGLFDTALQVSSSVSRTSVAPGEETVLTVTLTNPSSSPITLHLADPCQFRPYVANLAGTIVAPGGGGWVCAAVITPLTIGPRGSQAFSFVWAGETSFGAAMPPGDSLPAGDYRLYATLAATEGTYETPRYVIHLQ